MDNMEYITENDFPVKESLKDNVYLLVGAICVPVVLLFVFAAFKPNFIMEPSNKINKVKAFLWTILISLVIWTTLYSFFIM